jgi:Big-like domain-containing protein/PKD domain-containing protein
MRSRIVELLSLAFLAAAGWSLPGCDPNCDPATEDCSFSTTCCTPPAAVPSPPGALTLSCSDDGDPGRLDTTVIATVAGGTVPYAYVVNWGQGPETRGSGGNASSGARFRIDHTYPLPETLDPRNYDIRVTVTDAGNQTQSCTVRHRTDYPLPHMDCDASSQQGEAPLSVRFEARPYDCFGGCRVSWTFGDGDTFEGNSVNHTYAYPGPPPFFVFAAGATLRDSADRRAYCNKPVRVDAPAAPPGGPTSPMNHPPVLSNFVAMPQMIVPGGAPSQISATLSDPDGDPVSWTLSVDPGGPPGATLTPTSGTGNVSATFSATGQGQARLRLVINDGRGGSAQATLTISVTLG